MKIIDASPSSSSTVTVYGEGSDSDSALSTDSALIKNSAKMPKMIFKLSYVEFFISCRK